MKRIAVALLLLLATNVFAQSTPPAAAIWKQRVSFKSGNLTLVGFVFKPEGNGPFPAIVWNHGSEKNPGTTVQFDSVAGIFVPAGYVVFAPMRRGHGFSEGTYIVDSTAAVRTAKGADAAAQLVVHLMETEQLDDQLAGLAFVKKLSYVDTTRLVVAGCSYGGIQTLLAAERGAGYKAAIAISPAALSWEGNKYLQDRLKQASRKIDMPTMLLQPPKDASLEPSRVLGAELKHLGARFTGKVYPATGPEEQQQHCFGGAKGMHIWAPDALGFLKGVKITK
jgi:dienelactone hydrolase